MLEKVEGSMVNCEYCGKIALYSCGSCGKSVCEDHAKFRAICKQCVRKTALECAIKEVESDDERDRIRELVQRLWGEQEQLAFDIRFIIAELPSYVAKVKDDIVGFISFTKMDKAILVAALGILPQHQGSGIGRDLVGKVVQKARRLGKEKLLVSTSNDNLLALAFYQHLGFQIFEVKPNAMAEKHGKILKGIDGLPVKDELRLQKFLH